MDPEQHLDHQAPEPAPPALPAAPPTGIQVIFRNEKEIRAGWRLLLYLVLFVALLFAGSYAAAFLRLPQATPLEVTATGLLTQEAIAMLAALGAAAILGTLEGRRFGAYGLPARGAFRARFWMGAGWGLAMITAILLLISALGGFSFGSMALHGGAIAGYAVLWAVVFVCVGVFEEFLFRGYMQFTAAPAMGYWSAASMLSALWALSHLNNVNENHMGALCVFAIGMFFALTLRRTGDLWFAVGLHASFDWGETFLFSVPNSGIVATGHLLESSFHGSEWLTGGTVGPEGSMVTFAAVGLAAVIFSRLYPAREEDQF